MTASMTEVQFTAAITHEGDWYVARCLQVEVASQGESVESALANLREALELYFEDEPLPTDVEHVHERKLRLPDLAQHQAWVRDALEDRGYRVVAIRCDEALGDQVARHPETFSNKSE